MGQPLPLELSRLLEASDDISRQRAWEAFLEQYNRMLLRVSRSIDREYDEVMNCYEYMLEQLRANDFRRLRMYENDGRTKFSTWLMVAARRLAIDAHRKRYGRAPKGEDWGECEIRKRLVDLIAADIEPDLLIDEDAANPEQQIVADDRKVLLANVLEGLSTQDRLLLSLRFEYDSSVSEITEAMGFPSQFHVYRRLKKVLTQLRKALLAKGVSDASL
jgi:RNA polymerase sigma factor (sigma-70 family)